MGSSEGTGVVSTTTRSANSMLSTVASSTVPLVGMA